MEAIVSTLLTVTEVSVSSSSSRVGPKIIEILTSSPGKENDDDVEPMDIGEEVKNEEVSMSVEKEEVASPSEEASANISEEAVLTDKDLELFDPLLVHVRLENNLTINSLFIY